MTEKLSKRKYRATFILDTRGYQEPIETLVKKIEDTVVSLEGENVVTNDLGQKEFARVTDRKNPSGYYLQVDFDGPGSAPEQLQQKFKLDKTVDRILVQSL